MEMNLAGLREMIGAAVWPGTPSATTLPATSNSSVAPPQRPPPAQYTTPARHGSSHLRAHTPRPTTPAAVAPSLMPLTADTPSSTPLISSQVQDLQALIGAMQAEQKVSQRQLQQVPASCGSASGLPRGSIATRHVASESTGRATSAALLEHKHVVRQELDQPPATSRSQHATRSAPDVGVIDRLRERCEVAERAAGASLPTGLVAADLDEFCDALSALLPVRGAARRDLSCLMRKISRREPRDGEGEEWAGTHGSRREGTWGDEREQSVVSDALQLQTPLTRPPPPPQPSSPQRAAAERTLATRAWARGERSAGSGIQAEESPLPAGAGASSHMVELLTEEVAKQLRLQAQTEEVHRRALAEQEQRVAETEGQRLSLLAELEASRVGLESAKKRQQLAEREVALMQLERQEWRAEMKAQAERSERRHREELVAAASRWSSDLSDMQYHSERRVTESAVAWIANARTDGLAGLSDIQRENADLRKQNAALRREVSDVREHAERRAVEALAVAEAAKRTRQHR